MLLCYFLFHDLFPTRHLMTLSQLTQGLVILKVAGLSDVLLALERAQRAMKGSDNSAHFITVLTLRREPNPHARGGREARGTGATKGSVVGSVALVDMHSMDGSDGVKRAAADLESMLCERATRGEEASPPRAKSVLARFLRC
jgi:hypothetical protein